MKHKLEFAWFVVRVVIIAALSMILGVALSLVAIDIFAKVIGL